MLAGRLDVALLPVWGWGPRSGRGTWTPSGPRRRRRCSARGSPSRSTGGRWLPLGLHRRHARLLHEPGADFARHVARLAPEVDVRLVQPGEAVELGPDPG